MDDNLIKKYALQNAVKFEGKCNPGAVIGKVLQEVPDAKSRMKELSQQISKIVAEINKLSLEEQTAQLTSLAPELLHRKKVEKPREVPELKNATKGKVIMRFEPSPSGPMHIGHAYVLGLTSDICKKYKGKLILRIADTNAENIDPDSYDLLPVDGNWLTKNNIHEVAVQSDRMESYYKYMETLFNLDKAYVCTCDQDIYKDLITKCMPCPCRSHPREEQLERWKKMFKGYKKGDAVVRLKTDITHKNPAMRDFPLFRINETPHPRQKKKYRVWPLMNMAVTVDDIEMGITHSIRAKDHYDNAERQKIIYGYLGLADKYPQVLFVGRINFEGMPVSCSKTRKGIEEGIYSGWDDIRLPFLLALRKRGYQPEAFIKYAIDVGISLADKKVGKEEYFKTINANNKDIVDPISDRYFFVWDPKHITIKGAPRQKVELDLHPQNKKGGRKFSTHDKFFITEEDYKGINEGRLCRLMDCVNFRKEKSSFISEGNDFEAYKEKGGKIMHWLPDDDSNIKVEVLMEDNNKRKGLGEHSISHLKEGSIVQLERFGFVRLVEKHKDRLLFYFLHK